MSGTVDVCMELEKNSGDVASMLKSYDFPGKCPISKVKIYCSNLIYLTLED